MHEWACMGSVEEGSLMEDSQVCRMGWMGVVIRMMRYQRIR